MEPVNPDIARARTLDAAFYHDQQWLTRAREEIFVPSWQFIGDESLVPGIGSCHPFSLLPGLLNEPLLLTRDEEGIHCMPNVCTHRGNLVVRESCTQPQLRCTYHGRLFSLNGKFRSMPEFKEVVGFPTAADDLRSLPVFKWGSLLFSSLAGGIDHKSFLGDMIDRVGWLPMNEFKLIPERSREFVVKANWALYCENYLEGFHIPFVHAGLNAVIDYGNYTTELYSHSNLQLGIAKDEEDCFDLPPASPDYGKKVAAYYFFVFPNMMFNFYPWGLSVNIVEPNGIEQTKVRFITYVWKEDKFNTGAGSDLDTVEYEDEEVVEQVQRGVKSRFYSHGRYSVTREQGTHHFHMMVSRFLKL